MHPTDYLVHVSNLSLLAAYVVRDILWLRWFAVGASVTIIPYYLTRPNILWPLIAWSVVFIAINVYQIVVLYIQRRPVVLSEEERQLYDVRSGGFHSIPPREFLSLVLAGEWKTAKLGDKIMAQGESVASICIAISGAVEVRSHSKVIAVLRPGHVIGTALALAGGPSPVDAVFIEPGRYICWSLHNMRSFLDRRPELRATLQVLINRDLAEKVDHLVTAQTAANA